MKCHPLDEDPLNTSDHLPLICHLNLDLHSHLSPKIKPISHPKLNWKKVSTQEIHDTYTKAVEAALGPIPLPTLSALSSNPLEIDFHLDQLTSILTQIALSTIPTSKSSSHKRPGWSDDLNAAHRESKNAYKIWRAAGRPRNPDHPARMQYKEAKRKFKLKLRLHAKEQREEFFANLDLNTSNPSKLFRIIQKHNGLTPEPTRILNHQGMAYTNEHVLEGWEKYFAALSANDVGEYDDNFKAEIHQEFTQLLAHPPENEVIFTEEEVAEVVESLPRHKAAGPDEIDPEHLIYGGKLLVKHLTIILNAIVALVTSILHSWSCSSYPERS